MIITQINHSNMKASINYLYNKLSDDKCNIVESMSSNKTFEDFSLDIDILQKNYEDRSKRNLKKNSQMMHFVVSFKAEDKDLLNRSQESILNDVCLEMGIDPLDNNLTVFKHEDRNHPHYHFAFSKNAWSANRFNDAKIGWKSLDVCEKLNEKYNCAKPTKTNITLRRKHLYNPTDRGELIRTIQGALENTNSVSEFESFLYKHNVRPIKVNNEYTFHFKSDGKRAYFSESLLPWKCKYNYIKDNIHKHSLETSDKQALTDNIKKLDSCKTIGDIKELFPDAQIEYSRNSNSITNVEIHIDNDVYHLNERFEVPQGQNISIDKLNISSSIFNASRKSDEYEDDPDGTKKKKKKHNRFR